MREQALLAYIEAVKPEREAYLYEQALRRTRDVTRGMSPEEREAIDKLDLRCLTEFKRSGNGTTEVKLTDRVDILLRDPAPYISITGSSPDGVAFKACYWCRTEQRSEAKTMVEKEVRKAFEEAGIQPPVRRSDVRIMS